MIFMIEFLQRLRHGEQEMKSNIQDIRRRRTSVEIS